VPPSYFKAPPPLLAALWLLSANFSVMALFYIVFSWLEIMKVEGLLVYPGLRKFRTAYWVSMLSHQFISICLAVASAWATDYYKSVPSAFSALLTLTPSCISIIWRIHWGYWFVMDIVALVATQYYGSKAISFAASANRNPDDAKKQKKRTKKQLFILVNAISMFIPVAALYAGGLHRSYSNCLVVFFFFVWQKLRLSLLFRL